MNLQFMKKILFTFVIIFDISVLCYYKYTNFIIGIINQLVGTEFESLHLTFPLGISFYTFQLLAYIVDLYHGKYKAQKNVIDFSLYISFFPQLLQGPIIKYGDIETQLKKRKITNEKTSEGIRRFVYGLAKKVIIADSLSEIVNKLFTMNVNTLNWPLAWIASLGFTFQLYYDFSGYSDMAVGLGKLFGFDLPENFNYPYLSTSIQEFWRRWHISLGAWFREYLYIPLGGNKKGTLRTYINLLIVFFATGLWHGASYTFILWGLYHCFFSIVERIGLKNILKKSKPIAWLYSFFVINMGWVIFKITDIGQLKKFVKVMIGIAGNKVITSASILNIISNKFIFIMITAFIGIGFIQTNLPQKLKGKVQGSAIELVWCLMIFLISLSFLASSTYSPFIYFNF